MANDNGEVYYLPPSLARSPRHQDDDLIVFRGDDVAMYASYACSYAPFDNAPYAYDWTFTNHHYEEVDTG